MHPTCLNQQIAFVAIRAYAAHSHIYYQRHQNIISDSDYDALCKWLLENYEWIKPFDMNNYLEKSALGAGTGYQLKVIGQTLLYAEEILRAHIRALNKKDLERAPAKKTISMSDLI